MSERYSRRAVLAAGAASMAGLAGCGDTGDGESGTEPPVGDGGPPSVELGVERIAGGFTSPVGILALGDDRQLVADQPGQLALVEGGDVSTVLDLSEEIVPVSGYSEQGLLGLATHPAFESNGRLFVRYSAPRREGTPSDWSHTFVLAEFHMEPGNGVVDPESERTILEIPQPQGNHNAGDLAFGPDGYLYVPVGDGGGAGDRGKGHAEDWYETLRGGNGQDVTTNLLGSMLRIDVDSEGAGRPYDVPSDNPLVGEEGLDEHYAWGLRNPWRFSFAPDGRCLAADVGQNRFEEVNVIERGGNYGWNVREGATCFDTSECPTVTPGGVELRPPVVQYGRNGPVSGVAVIGGYVYRGSELSALDGQYVFGDWRSQGRLFVASEAEDGLWPTGTLPFAGDGPGQMLLTIGEDPDGEMLIGTTNRGGVEGTTGELYRVTSPA